MKEVDILSSDKVSKLSHYKEKTHNDMTALSFVLFDVNVTVTHSSGSYPLFGRYSTLVE